MWEGCKHTEISVVTSETVKTGGTGVPVISVHEVFLYLNAASWWTEQGITGALNPDADTSRSAAAALIIYCEGV